MLDDSINDSKRGGDRSETGGGVEEEVLKGGAEGPSVGGKYSPSTGVCRVDARHRYIKLVQACHRMRVHTTAWVSQLSK